MGYLREHRDSVLAIELQRARTEVLDQAAELIWSRLQHNADFLVRLAEPSNALDLLTSIEDSGLFNEARMDAIGALLEEPATLEDVALTGTLVGIPVLVVLKPRVVELTMQLCEGCCSSGARDLDVRGGEPYTSTAGALTAGAGRGGGEAVLLDSARRPRTGSRAPSRRRTPQCGRGPSTSS